MNPTLCRLVAFLLVPCLLVDPALAAHVRSFSPLARFARTNGLHGPNGINDRLAEQAVVAWLHWVSPVNMVKRYRSIDRSIAGGAVESAHRSLLVAGGEERWG